MLKISSKTEINHEGFTHEIFEVEGPLIAKLEEVSTELVGLLKEMRSALLHRGVLPILFGPRGTEIMPSDPKQD